MKAFLGSEETVHACGTYHPMRGWAPSVAVCEARTILAHAEPIVPCRDIFGAGRTSATEHSKIGPGSHYHPYHMALKDALSAFVAEGGPRC